MFSKPTRVLVDVAAFFGITWMWVVIYQSFTHTGLWRIVDEALGAPTTMPAQAAVIAVCVLIGWVSLAIVCYVAWFVFVRRRAA